jgi:heterodisulfide reductase subunit D
MFLKVVGRGGSEDGQPLKDAVKILRKIGVNPGYLAEEEPCCGGILHYMGAREEFVSHAYQASAKLKSKGVKNIISIVPSCTYTLKNIMAEANGESVFQVQHFSEFLAENLAALRLRFPRPAKVTYHDPCQLVRYLGIIEQPRRILKAISGIELVEPQWTRGEWATCCGGGGGFEAVFPEMSEMLAANRARELVETGAQIIVTHCPGCIMQLKTGLKMAKAENVEVLDLAQVVAMSLEA